MKYLLIVVVVLALIWLARASTRADKRASESERPNPGRKARGTRAEDIVACAQCGVHLPRSEALPGRGGMFCGEPHRLVYERKHHP